MAMDTQRQMAFGLVAPVTTSIPYRYAEIRFQHKSLHDPIQVLFATHIPSVGCLPSWVLVVCSSSAVNFGFDST